MFNQERGVAEGRAAVTCANPPSAGTHRASGPCHGRNGCSGSARTRVGLKWETREDPGCQLFGFVKCLRFARRAGLTRNKEQGEEGWGWKDEDEMTRMAEEPVGRGAAALQLQPSCSVLQRLFLAPLPFPLLV